MANGERKSPKDIEKKLENEVQNGVCYDDILDAANHLQGVAHETPLEFSKALSAMAGCNAYFKLENFQLTGSFKIRGAYNKMAHLSQEVLRRGVIAASAGNHAQGVAFAAREKGIPCTIVMSQGASLAKVSATQRYGAKVILYGESYDDAYDHAREIQSKTKAAFIHAFDDGLVIAGQGTVGHEILGQLPQVDAVVVPLGGGGLVSGIAVAAKTVRKGIKVYGVEAQSIACFRESLDRGAITTLTPSGTIADGIAVRRPGDLTFKLVSHWMDDVVTVTDEEIAHAMVFMLEQSKMVVEGAAAAAIAAVMERKLPIAGKNVAIVVSGGNVDVSVLSKVIEHGLAASGRYLRLSVLLPDAPGALRNMLDVIALQRANVYSIMHHRLGPKIPFGHSEVEIDLETRDHKHCQQLMRQLKQRGYHPRVRR